MINFFRKIRQRLLTENPPVGTRSVPARNGSGGRAGKFSKYLLYAIGEILLVVIGILIALSINYRNEKHKDHTIEEENSLKLLRDGIS